MKVFIVDDSKPIRDRLHSTLAGMTGVTVAGEAAEKMEAVSRINETRPDVVILDIRLPKGNGIEVLEEIKKGDKPPVIIMLTNYPYPQYRQKCLQCGADFFLDKSTEFDKLTEIIAGLRTRS